MYSTTDFSIESFQTPWLTLGLLAVAIFCLAALAAIRWRTYHKVLKALQASSNGKCTQEHLPKVSIVIPAYNEANALEQNLPRIFKQDYKGEFEVIVVDENSTDDTHALIERLQQDHHNLRSTFIPASTRNIEYRKLAITLGIRAARAEWVVVLNADCEPASASWLAHLASYFTDELDFVAGYVNFDFDHTASTRRCIAERLLRQVQRYSAWTSGCMTGCETSNYAVRKSAFLSHNGFADSLCIPFGEESIFVSKQMDASQSLLCLQSDMAVFDSAPSAQYARMLRVTECETKHHLSAASRHAMWKNTIATWFAQLLVWVNLIYAAIRMMHDGYAESYSIDSLPTDLAMLLIDLVCLITPLVYMRHIATLLQAPALGMPLVANALLAPWRSLRLHITHYAHRAEFVRNYMVHLPQQ